MKKATELSMAMGQRIKRYRKSNNMSQETLAELLHFTPTHISVIERGLSPVTVDTLVRLCGIFQISSDELIYGQRSRGVAGPLISRLDDLTPQQIVYFERIIDCCIALSKLKSEDTK